jgi:eukaryotic-like serine/threonine-protein kinase
MELPKLPQNLEPRESASDGEQLDGRVALFLRLWSYGGPSQPPTGLAPEQDPEIAALIQDIVGEGKGEIGERLPEVWSAQFTDAAHALSTAKALQQRFLTFQRKTEPRQVVPSILIYSTKTERASEPDAADPEDMLANVTSAQILIAGTVYEQMKSVPGFRFNPKPVREAGETFGGEAIYELLWTDESTYGHLRHASRAGLKTVGRYHIQEELGRGAMGAVYKAYDERIGRTVALKTISIDRNAPGGDELIERLKQEAKAAGGLDHPNIITIYDVGQEDDVVYLSMQYVKGITLATLLAEVGVPSLATFLSWADQICAAVGFAHARGVIHRDLKPANIMVTEEGIIKVLDFGIAKIENTSLTQTGLVVGTPSYMAPEQLAGKKMDQRADIFSLGSVFYELVTREKPFQGDVTTVLYKIMHEEPVAPSLVNPALPGGIDAVIRRALAKVPKERFQKCEEMRKAFAEQAARLNLSPAVPGNAAMTIAKVNPRPSPPLPSFLLTESAPKRRRVWPILLMLLFIGTAGWAFYVHSNTGSYPAFVNKLVGASQQLPQTLRGLQPADPAGQGKSNAPDASANSVGAQAASTPHNAPGTATQTAPDDSDVAASALPTATGGQSSNPAAASDGASVVPATSPATQPAGTATPSQPGTAAPSGTAAGIAAAPAENIERSPFSPVDVNGQVNPGIAAHPPKKPIRQPIPTVDGFTIKNVPELLRAADSAAQRGDYRLAAYSYNLILKLDHTNAPAHNGLRLIQQAEHLH